MCLVADCFFSISYGPLSSRKIFFNERGNFCQQVISSLKGFKLNFVFGKS